LTENIDDCDEYRWYSAERGNGAVRLWLRPDMATRLQQHLEPYVSIKPGEPAVGSWTIRSAGRNPAGQHISQRLKGDVGYDLRFDGAERTLSLSPASADAELTQVRRLVRCLLRRHAMADGDCFLHSGLAISRTSGRGIAVAGIKRAGKTSLMLALLLSGSYAYSSNDDLTISFAASEATARGWPRAVAIRRDTLRSLAKQGLALRATLRASRHPAQLKAGNPVDHRAILFPDELARATASEVLGEAPLSAVILPGFDSSVTAPRIELVDDHRSAVALLLDQVEARASRQESWLDPYFVQPTSDQLTAHAERLAATVPVFRLTQSMDCLMDSARALHDLAITGP
jgi:hypothetical protein